MDQNTQTEINNLKKNIEINVLAPKVIDAMFKKRVDKTNYVSGGNTVACDTVFEIEWNGARYRIPAFKV